MDKIGLLIFRRTQVAGATLELALKCPDERSDDMSCTAEGGTIQGEILDVISCFRGREGC